MKKVFWFDVETTGLDHINNDIIELSVIIEIDGELKESHVWHCQPYNYENISRESLSITGYTIEELRTFRKPHHVYSELIQMLSTYIDKYDRHDKFWIGGYNVSFDINFLKTFFHKNFDNFFGSWFNYKQLDPLHLLRFMDFYNFVSLDDYKLSTACLFYNIYLEAHNSLSDITATRDLFYLISDKLKGGVRSVAVPFEEI